jgi:hypothetical protein
MDIEDLLKKLQSLFSYTLSDAQIAKDRYLALSAEPNSSQTALARARATWRQFEHRKMSIIARMVQLEELEQETVG